jgi:hypothetical protein
MGLSRGFYMTVYFDANNIYDAGTKAMQSSKFKHSTQLFEMNPPADHCPHPAGLHHWGL